jgi:hypothetical protein
MYGKLRILTTVGCASALATTLACSSAPDNPTAPSTTTAVSDTGAGPDGSTLKAPAPTPVSPTDDTRLTNRSPTMVANNTAGKFTNNQAFTYEFQLQDDGGNVIRSASLAPGEGTTTWVLGEDLARDTPYRWRVRATRDGAATAWSATSRFLTVKENRTPNPGGGRLPRPDAMPIIAQVVDANPGITSSRRSCQDPAHGGHPITGWEFMDKVVDALRLTDTRWGYNGKRGNAADPSFDVIAYNWGNQPDEGTTEVYIFDILLGHCGGAGIPTQSDITGVGGALGRWTSRGRFPGSFGLQ